MKSLNRRDLIAAATALALPPTFAQTGRKPMAGTLKLVIPANPGGGWDQTGRALGAALLATGAVERVEYLNVGGKGGTIGLAQYVQQHAADADALLMGGFVMVGAVALQQPPVGIDAVQPVARLTSDYPVVVVAEASPIRNAAALADALRANAAVVPIAGGSAGGVDHLFAGVLARAAKARPDQLNYLPFASGAEVVDAVVGGKAQVGISGYSEFADAIAAKKLRAIGVAARRPVQGVPSFREQGLDADMANWRGVFTGKQVPAERTAQWVAAIERAAQSPGWVQTLKANRWEPALSSGKDFAQFIDLDLTTARVMVHVLKLRK